MANANVDIPDYEYEIEDNEENKQSAPNRYVIIDKTSWLH
jgi:hypothetical protein